MYGYILFLVSTILFVQVKGSLDITFKKYEMCEDHKNTPVQYRANFTKINSTITLADIHANLTVPLGEDVILNCLIEVYRNNEWQVLYNVSNRPVCSMLNKYGAGLWFDLQKHFNVTPGSCPLPKGYYEAKDYIIDFSKLPAIYTPNARIRSTSHMMQNEELLLCFFGELDIRTYNAT